MSDNVKIRVATTDDAQALLDIYGFYIMNTALSFEYEVPSVEDFRKRITNTLKKYPYLVAESEGKIIGFSYASRFKERVAYAWNAETTIYLDINNRRAGVGRQLYTLLENILKEQGVVKTVACITKPVDEYTDFNSMQFHGKMGYHLAGEIENNGYKKGRWYTVIWMDKMIGVPEDEVSEIKAFDEVKYKFGL